MHPGVKRKRSSSHDYSAIFERQQKSLFDLSVIKLQQEQVRNGVEPRLLRFVLINNALRVLQAHMVRLADDDALGPLDYDGMSKRFLSNTFKETCTFGTTTPTKLVKLEVPIAEGHSTDVSSTVCEEVDGKQLNVEQRQSKDKKVSENQNRVLNVSLGKRSSEMYHKNDCEECPSRKICRPYLLHMNGTTITTGSSDIESTNGNPVSPIDFTKVDPSLYDFDDTQTSLVFPLEGLRNISSSTMSGLVNCNIPFSSTSEFYTTRTVNGIATPVSHSTDLPATSDLLDEIEQIVSLLMP